MHDLKMTDVFGLEFEGLESAGLQIDRPELELSQDLRHRPDG